MDYQVKALPIPAVIDDYNHYMGSVDVANQLSARYHTHRPTFRSWWPLFYWIIDAAVVNSYRISCISQQQHRLPIYSQTEYREMLYQRLFKHADALGTVASEKRQPTYQQRDWM